MITGTLGKAGWYRSDVTVALTVEDPESGAVTKKGCQGGTVAADTSGVTFGCAAISAGGSYETSVIIKRDTHPPALACPQDVTVEATGPAGARVPFSASAADELDPAPALTASPGPNSDFALGTTAVAVSAVDAAGNSASCAFKVKVVDTTPPVLACPDPLVAEAADSQGAAVSYPQEKDPLVR